MKKLFACLVILGLVGCGSDDHEDIKQWMAEQSVGLAGNVKQPPPLIPPPVVSYAAKDIEPPFSPAKIRAKEFGLMDKNSPAYGRAPEYLENFPLESLRVIGVIGYSGRMFALVQSPEKPKHVTVGNFMGPNFGEITEITNNEVRIVERVKDSSDEWVKRNKVLYLQQAEGEKK